MRTKNNCAITMEKNGKTKLLITTLVAAAGLFAAVATCLNLFDTEICRLLSLLLLCGIFVAWVVMTLLNYRDKQKHNDYIDAMVHELKTPLAGMQLICEMLADKSINLPAEDRSRYIGTMKTEIDRLKMLIGNILGSSKAAKTKHFALKDSVRVNPLLGEVADLFAAEIKQSAGMLNIEKDESDSTLLTDQTQLKNILVNLVENAIKYSRDKIVITLTARQESDSFVIEVKDEGIGIEKKNLKKIFRKGFRAKSSDASSQVKGFGIGLFYVYHTCKALRGEVQVKSKTGEGSVFSLKFPKELIITTKQ